MKRNDYTSISNLQQLRQAREQLSFTVKLKGNQLKYDTAACKEALNPVTYINRLVNKLYSMEYLVKYFIKGYEYVRGMWDKKENTSRDMTEPE